MVGVGEVGRWCNRVRSGLKADACGEGSAEM